MIGLLDTLLNVERYPGRAEKDQARLIYGFTLVLMLLFTGYAAFVVQRNPQTAPTARGDGFQRTAANRLHDCDRHRHADADTHRARRPERGWPGDHVVLSGVVLGLQGSLS